MDYRSRPRIGGAILAGVFIVSVLGGCATGEPRTRLGGLPCPGLFTLFTLADPNDLGTARYENMPRWFQRDECGHGILYTERGGFLDMAHVRESMDWSWYGSKRVAETLTARKTTLDLGSYDYCPLRLTFRYPKDWDGIPTDERKKVINELSIRIGERVALNTLAWHELITWFGYGTTIIWSEKASAFTYEDIMSHVIGVQAADDALRHPTGSWDLDATRALADELKKVGVVSKPDAARAVELVKGKWWSSGTCIKRLIDIGLVDDTIHPWLVRGMPWGDKPAPGYRLPTFKDVGGRDFSGFWSMTIKPTIFIPGPVLTLCPEHPEVIDVDVDFPPLMAAIRQRLLKEFGPTADRPYDD